MESVEAGGEEVPQASALPDDLVERIVAMVPYPYIYKARCLSRSWRARFASVSSEDDDDDSKKCLAASFQRQVAKWARNWESFSPVYMGKEDFVAYSPSSEKWGRLPSLFFLPERLVLGTLKRFLTRSFMQMEGPLLFGFAPAVSGSGRYHPHVANILTRDWKQLPPRPDSGSEESWVLCTNLVVDPLGQSYRLILICGTASRSEEGCHFSAQIYESKSGAWSSKDFTASGDFAIGPCTAVDLNGVLYIVAVNNPQILLAIDMEEWTSRELRLSFDGVIEIVSVNLVICKSSWLLIVTKGLYPETLQVLKADLESLQLVELARGPSAEIKAGKVIAQPVGDGDSIFFRVEESASQVLRYNLDRDEWTCFPVPAAASDLMPYKWIGSSFKPGLCPFVAV